MTRSIRSPAEPVASRKRAGQQDARAARGLLGHDCPGAIVRRSAISSVLRPSRSDSLDDAQRALGWHDPSQLQHRLCEDRGEFVLGALAPTDDEHINIKELAPAG